MNTYAPSATKRFAVAKPMPLLPPVIRATFPVSLSNIFSNANCIDTIAMLSIHVDAG
jgi:hypothetical protein